MDENHDGRIKCHHLEKKLNVCRSSYYTEFSEICTVSVRDVEAEAVKFLWKRKHFEEPGSELGSIRLFEDLKAEAFFIKHGAGMWKHFEERSWKRKQTRQRFILTLYGAGSGSKNILLLPHSWFQHIRPK